ncbi:MAG TPA: flagellar biosynthesis protein FlhB [Steroidobacteraceae bacterium]|jgi:flagellar biosynthetic protein FlhB
MAERDEQERTEQATPKRLEEARRKGQIPRSRDLSAAAVTLAGGLALYFMGASLTGRIHDLMQRALTISRDQALDTMYVLPALSRAAMDALILCAPVFITIVLAALLAPLALGGWSFTTEPLMPQFSRLNPIEGFKRMFALRSFVELGKAFAKFGIVAVVAVIVLWNEAPALLALGREPVQQAIGHAAQLSGQGLIAVSFGLLIIAGFDVPWQLWQYAKQMRMSRQEIREEYKESEGSPEMKGRIRQVQQELARRRMMQDVPKADVVVTNPTHFAVALRYDENRMRAPVVVAKGVDLVAAKIRELAVEHSVPIFEAPPLARVLYRNVDIGAEIPASLYVAVAQVLSYVFQLRMAVRNGQTPPPKPDIEVEEFGRGR